MGENRLFVGSLPTNITKEELEIVFRTYGEVTDTHIIGGDRARSTSGQACAFVSYAQRQAGEDAIQVLNGVYKIREGEQAPIQVSWARPTGGGSKGKDSGGGKGGSYDSYGGCKGGGCQGGGCYGGGCGGGYGPAYGCGGCGGSCSGYGYDPYGGKGGGGWGGDAWGSKGCGGGGWGGDKGGCWGGGGGGGKGWSGGGGDKGGGGGCGGGGSPGPTPKLFVGNLPIDIGNEALEYVFNSYGKVQKVHIMAGKSNSGQSCAFVEYSTSQEADVAIQTLNDKYEIKPGAGMIMVKRAKGGNSKGGPN